MDQLDHRGTQDRSQININEPQQVRYWTQQLDVGANTLWAAVLAVGPSAEAVRRYLNPDDGDVELEGPPLTH